MAFAAARRRDEKDILLSVRTTIEAIQGAASSSSGDIEFSRLRTAGSQLYWRCSLVPPITPTSDNGTKQVVADSELKTLEDQLVTAMAVAEERRLQRVLLPTTRERVSLSETERSAASEAFVIVFDHLKRIESLFDAGVAEEALWLCRFGYWSEWGEGLLRALRTLHVLVNPVETIFHTV